MHAGNSNEQKVAVGKVLKSPFRKEAAISNGAVGVGRTFGNRTDFEADVKCGKAIGQDDKNAGYFQKPGQTPPETEIGTELARCQRMVSVAPIIDRLVGELLQANRRKLTAGVVLKMTLDKELLVKLGVLAFALEFLSVDLGKKWKKQDFQTLWAVPTPKWAVPTPESGLKGRITELLDCLQLTDAVQQKFKADRIRKVMENQMALR